MGGNRRTGSGERERGSTGSSAARGAMNIDQIKSILIQIHTLRQEVKGKSLEERTRSLMLQQRLRRQIRGDFDGVPTEALVQEANKL